MTLKLISSFHSVFLTTPLPITSLTSLKLTGTGSNLSTSTLSPLLFKLIKLLGNFSRVSAS